MICYRCENLIIEMYLWKDIIFKMYVVLLLKLLCVCFVSISENDIETLFFFQENIKFIK